MLWAIISLVVSALAIGVAAYFYKWVQALPVEEEKIRNIGELIRNGAFTFLKRSTVFWPFLLPLYQYWFY